MWYHVMQTLENKLLNNPNGITFQPSATLQRVFTYLWRGFF